LGIKGKWALVCGSSKGLAYGCAAALASEGVNLVLTARTASAVQAAAETLKRLHPGIDVRAAPGDISTKEGREAALVAAPQIDILINNAGGPPPGDIRDWGREDWIRALDANMLAPIELIKATIGAMEHRGFGRIVNITSSAVKAPLSALGLSNGARSGLTGFVAGLARQPELASRNVTLNNLLPGTFDTDRLQSILANSAKKTGQPLDDVLKNRRAVVPAKRFGSIEEFGATCAFLCSTHAGYLTGQNILLDGGAYPGVF
jgi:3-oxoacyl-[acyl-carrier protein] reductase